MKRAELDALKAKIAEKKDKASDLDVVMEQLAKAFAIVGKLLPDEVKAVLEKYGYTE